MVDKISEIIPKALVPLTVLFIGFLILAVSMIFTKLVFKMYSKIKDKAESNKKNIDNLK